jgi:pyridoxamine 5'-phosphate oxidase
MVAEYAARTPGEVTRPTWWKGYVVRPERIEFWSAGEDRLHDRIVFTRSGSAWAKERLFP